MKKHLIAGCLALAASSSAHAVYLDPTIGNPRSEFVSVAGSVSYDGWNELSRAGLGFPNSPSKSAEPALVEGIQANVIGSGDAVLTRITGTMYPSGSAIYNAGDNTPNVLRISDSTLAANVSTLVLQSYIGLLQPNSYATAVLNYNGGSQALVANSMVSVVPTNPNEYYSTWIWDLSGLGELDSFSLDVTVGGGAVQAWAFQVDEVTATPVPAALPLFATGLGALGLIAHRRKRKQAA